MWFSVLLAFLIQNRVRIGHIYLALLLALSKPAFVFVSALIIALGMWIRFVSSGFIKKEVAVAKSGPYSACRNPLYFGSALIGIGFTLLSGLLWMFIPFVVIFIPVYTLTIVREEERLSRLFGEEYDRYRKATPRILPHPCRIHRLILLSGFSKEHLRKNLEIGGIIALTVLFLLFLLKGQLMG